MLRYLAFLWDPKNVAAAITAKALRQRLPSDFPNWSLLLTSHGLALFVASSPFDCYAPHLLGKSGGVVLGLLFDRRNPGRTSARYRSPFFDEYSTDEVLQSEGRHLVQDYWGRYVAFLCDAAKPHKRILRDPIGDIPCYRAKVQGVDVYFSDLPDFLRLKSLPLSVNWQHLAFRAITGNAWADESALNEVETVHPGECILHDGARESRQYYWHPFTIARSNPIKDKTAAIAEFRSATKACAHAWATLHESAVHVLSGGLDSSIVLACLADAPSRPRISCLNFRTRDPDSDERAYARLVAARTGYELVEQKRLASLSPEQLFECGPATGPVSDIMRGLEVQPLIAQFAKTRSATAIFSGDGGDMICFRGWPQLAVIDAAWQRGLNAGLVRLAVKAALPAQLSVPRLLYDAARHGVLRQKWDIRKIIFHHYRLVTEAVIERARQELDFLNPWKYPLEDLPPGKVLHAFSVTRPCLFRDPMRRQPELDVINPLVSQPVVEVALRIPTYLHAADGRDRAVARDAFAPDLPREIVVRTWKGAADRHLKDMLTSNLNFARELLMDGALVKEGILDRKRLEEALSGGPTRNATHASEVFGYVCTEAWLRYWASPNDITTACSFGT